MSQPRRVALERHYRRTTYRLWAPGAVDVRIGRRAVRLDRLLRRYRRRSWLFITAYNPCSVPRAADANERAQRRLRQALRGLRAVVFRGAGVPDVAGWDAEPSWLALGVAMPAARRLARRYGQNAVVAGRLDGPARLVWCR